MDRYMGRAFTICLALVAFCAVDVYSQECGNVQGQEQARIQGSPGKRGEPGIVDYDKVKKMIKEQVSREQRRHVGSSPTGPTGPSGPPGPPGTKETVKYDRIEGYIDMKVKDALANISSQLQEMKRHVERIAMADPRGCEVYYDNMCFFYVVHSTYDITFDKAESICEERGANVANIYSKRHYDLIMANLRPKMPDGWSWLTAWTGLRRNPMDGSVTLRNGNPAPFTLWRFGFPDTGSSYSTRSHIYLLVRSDPGARDQGMGNNNNHPRSSMAHGVVCQD